MFDKEKEVKILCTKDVRWWSGMPLRFVRGKTYVGIRKRYLPFSAIESFNENDECHTLGSSISLWFRSHFRVVHNDMKNKPKLYDRDQEALDIMVVTLKLLGCTITGEFNKIRRGEYFQAYTIDDGFKKLVLIMRLEKKMGLTEINQIMITTMGDGKKFSFKSLHSAIDYIIEKF